MVSVVVAVVDAVSVGAIVGLVSMMTVSGAGELAVEERTDAEIEVGLGGGDGVRCAGREPAHAGKRVAPG